MTERASQGAALAQLLERDYAAKYRALGRADPSDRGGVQREGAHDHPFRDGARVTASAPGHERERLFRLIDDLGDRADIARGLCHRLYAVCERRQRPAEAQAYNALVQRWPKIVRLADAAAGKPGSSTCSTSATTTPGRESTPAVVDGGSLARPGCPACEASRGPRCRRVVTRIGVVLDRRRLAIFAAPQTGRLDVWYRHLMARDPSPDPGGALTGGPFAAGVAA